MKMTERKAFGVTLITLLLSVLFIGSITSVSALSFAESDDFETVSTYGTEDEIPGYVRSQDTFVLEVKVDSSSSVDPDKVRAGANPSSPTMNAPFQDCSKDISGVYTCTIEEDVDRGSTWRGLSGNVYLYESLQDDPVDEIQFSVSTDRNAPTIDDVNVIGRSGGLGVNLVARDDESGIRRVEIREDDPISGPVVDTHHISPDEDGVYPEVFDDYENELLEVPLAEGEYELFVVVYDGLGNHEFSRMFEVEFISTPPEILSWDVGSCSRGYDPDYDIGRIGPDGESVCAYVLVDREPNSYWDMSAELTNFDRSSDSLVDNARSVTLSESDCSEEEENYVCKITNYDDGEALRLQNTDGGGYTFTSSFTFIDEFGNEGTHESSNTVEVVNTEPEISDFSSIDVYQEKSYVSPEMARFRLNFTADAEIDESETTLDASDIGGSSSEDPVECAEDHCIWEFDPLSGSLTDGTVSLNSLVDVFGNSASFSRWDDDVEVNDIHLELTRMHISEVDSASDRFWATECPGGDAPCSSCLFVDREGQSSDACTNDNFWLYMVDSFEEDDAVDLSVNISGGLNPSILVEAAESEGDTTIETSCEPVGDPENSEFSCERTIPVPIGRFNLSVNDMGGTFSKYDVPFASYHYGGERELWNSISIGEKEPEKINRMLMSIGTARYTVAMELIGGPNVLSADAACTVYGEDEDGEEVSMDNLITGTTSDWSDAYYYLSLEFKNTGGGSLDDYLGEDGEAEVRCNIEAFGQRNGELYSQLFEDIDFEIIFYDAPYGTPSETVKDEIDDIKDKWEDYSANFAGLSRVLEHAERTCRTHSVLTTTVLPVLAWAVDGAPLGWHTAPAVSLESVSTSLEKVNNIIAGACDIVYCRWCNNAGDDTSDSEGSLEDGLDREEGKPFANNAMCGENGWLTLYREQFVGRMQNLDEVIMNDIFGMDEDEGYNKFTEGIGVDRSLDTDSSLFTSIITACPSGILRNAEKTRQIDCGYIKCLNEVADGGPPHTINNCKMKRGYDLCAYSMGGVWQYIPFGDVIDFVSDVLRDVMTIDPAALSGYAGHITCKIICNFGDEGSAGCLRCTMIENIGEMVGKVTDFVNFMTSNLENDMEHAEFFTANNACEDIEGMESGVFGWTPGADDEDDEED